MTAWTNLLLRTGPDRERANIVWNMAGSFCYAFASMALSFFVMRMAGEEAGGVFAFGYSTLGQQLFLVAYFGLRPFQITDTAGAFSFGDYRRHRAFTCAAALVCAALYLGFSGYSPDKAGVLFLLSACKIADGFADVYESEFQRQGCLYLTGKSNTFRTLLLVSAFLTVLAAFGNLTAACAAAVLAQIIGCLLFDVCVLPRLGSADYGYRAGGAARLTRSSCLLFASVFLDFYVFSAAKYAIDAHLNDAASGYFNLIFMPTSVINLAAGFVIRPFLTSLSASFDGRDRAAFTGKICRLTAAVSVLSLLAVGGTFVLGRPALCFLELLLGAAYAGKLTMYWLPFTAVVLGGGFYALLSLYFYVLVIMRLQGLIFGIYCVMTAAALVLAPALVVRYGIAGAAAAYLALMAVSAALFAGGAWAGIRRMGMERTDGR